jgi:signal transduction histidine kinase
LFEELLSACNGKLTGTEVLAVDMALDTALQRGVTTFVNYLTAELKSAAESELKYISFLSHDLRNNLNSITLSLDWLTRRLGSAAEFKEDARDLASLQQAVTETVEGMDRLLQAERLRRRDVTLKLRPVDLHRLAGDLLGQLTRRAMDKGLKLENAVPNDAGAHSDRELLALVLQNLLGNAIKYSPRGTVRLEAIPDPLGWKVSVTDQGPGIDRKLMDGLFKAFSRGETHGQPGVGLGLTIAAHAARHLGTELKVESTVGKGSSFSFTLPPAKPEVSL